VSNDFADYFARRYSFNNQQRAEQLKQEYLCLYATDTMHGLSLSDMYTIDTELVDNVAATMSRGKAAGIDRLSAEHLIFSHTSVLACRTCQLSCFGW